MNENPKRTGIGPFKALRNQPKGIAESILTHSVFFKNSRVQIPGLWGTFIIRTVPCMVVSLSSRFRYDYIADTVTVPHCMELYCNTIIVTVGYDTAATLEIIVLTSLPDIEPHNPS
jgi:hypothetical protein